jgi:hypothetical protein
MAISFKYCATQITATNKIFPKVFFIVTAKRKMGVKDTHLSSCEIRPATLLASLLVTHLLDRTKTIAARSVLNAKTDAPQQLICIVVRPTQHAVY